MVRRFDPDAYIRKLQAQRAGLAKRDYDYDMKRAKEAKDPLVQQFYLNEAAIDRDFAHRRERASVGSGFLRMI